MWERRGEGRKEGVSKSVSFRCCPNKDPLPSGKHEYNGKQRQCACGENANVAERCYLASWG
jgi:hypothetical protein